MTKQEKYFEVIGKYYDPKISYTQNGVLLASTLGVTPRTARALVAAYCKLGGVSTPKFTMTTHSTGEVFVSPTAPVYEYVESATLEVEDIKTLSELLAYSEVDQNKFKVRSQKVDKTASGKITVSATLDAVEQTDYKSEISNLLDNWTQARLTQEITYNLEKPERQNDNLLVINCFDVHFGKVSNPEITGAEYNLEIAKEKFFSVIHKIATRAFYMYGVEEVVLCTGGDFFNTDTEGYTTTGGTPQQGEGSSYQKLFTEGCNAVIQALEMLAGFAKKVTFVNVNGNHDRLSSFYLGEVVRTYFKEVPNVVIDNSPVLRKYYSYGENCFMFTHGDKSPDRLPLIFAKEYKQFSLHSFQNIFLGHYHRTDKKFFGGETEYNGVNVRTFNSISAPDAWHVGEGYIGSIRKADGLLYSKTDGKIGEISEIVK